MFHLSTLVHQGIIHGYLMSESYSHARSMFSCVDHSLVPVTGPSHNQDGFLFYTVEGVCGSLPYPPYDRKKELSCSMCTKLCRSNCLTAFKFYVFAICLIVGRLSVDYLQVALTNQQYNTA